MENKKVGWLIIGISIAVAIITLVFNYSMKSITQLTCTHGPECSMFTTINFQLGLGLAIVVIIFVIGLFIMFSKPDEKIIIKKVKEKQKKKRIDLSKFDKDEKSLIQLLQKEEGGMFQRDIMEKMEIGKVKMTRLLDKLESKQLVIRKRRGMNNIILLKN